MEIKDFSLIAFKAMIEHIYTGPSRAWAETFEDNLDVMFQLLCLADKYLQEELKKDMMIHLDYFPVSSENYAIVFKSIAVHQDLMGFDELCSKLAKRCALTVLREWKTNEDRALFLSADDDDDPSLKQALMQHIGEFEAVKCSICDRAVSVCRDGVTLGASNCEEGQRVRATADLTCETGRHEVPEGSQGVVALYKIGGSPILKDKKLRREYPFCCRSSKLKGFLAIFWFHGDDVLTVHAVDPDLLNIVIHSH